MATVFYDYKLLNKSDDETKNKFMQKHKISENDLILYNDFFWIPNNPFKPENCSKEEVSELRAHSKLHKFSISNLIPDITRGIILFPFISILLLIVHTKNKQLLLPIGITFLMFCCH